MVHGAKSGDQKRNSGPDISSAPKTKGKKMARSTKKPVIPPRSSRDFNEIVRDFIVDGRHLVIPSVENGEACLICLIKPVNPTTTSCCLKNYCNECINSWCCANRTCPHCRSFIYGVATSISAKASPVNKLIIEVE